MAYYPEFLKFAPSRWQVDQTETGIEPLTLAQLREHLRVDDDVTEWDVSIAAYARAARRLCEQMMRRAIVLQTRVLRMDRFPDAADQHISLPGGKVQSVTSVTYTDSAGSAQTFAGYNAELGSERYTGRLFLQREQAWPVDVADVGLPVVITYEAGYDIESSPADVIPEEHLIVIRMITDALFNERSATPEAAVNASPILRSLIYAGRVWSIR